MTTGVETGNIGQGADAAQSRLVPELLYVQLRLSQAERTVETAPKGPSTEIKPAVEPEEKIFGPFRPFRRRRRCRTSLSRCRTHLYKHNYPGLR